MIRFESSRDLVSRVCASARRGNTAHLRGLPWQCSTSHAALEECEGRDSKRKGFINVNSLQEEVHVLEKPRGGGCAAVVTDTEKQQDQL